MKKFINKVKQKWFYSLVGLWTAFREEKSMVVLLVISMVLVGLGIWVKLDTTEWAIVVLTLFLSLIIEVINTALEAAVDTISFQYNVKVKKIKDIASAATFLMTMAAGIIIGIIYITSLMAII